MMMMPIDRLTTTTTKKKWKQNERQQVQQSSSSTSRIRHLVAWLFANDERFRFSRWKWSSSSSSSYICRGGSCRGGSRTSYRNILKEQILGMNQQLRQLQEEKRNLKIKLKKQQRQQELQEQQRTSKNVTTRIQPPATSRRRRRVATRTTRNTIQIRNRIQTITTIKT